MLSAGIDEAGKGSLISRVYTGIVVLPDNFIDLCKEEKIIIRDSKKMSEKQRNRSRIFIEKYAVIITFNIVIMKRLIILVYPEQHFVQ